MSALSTVKRFYPNVKTVVDAKSPMIVEVSKRDSNSARVKDHKECALAVACKRKAHADGVLISLSVAYVVKGDTAMRYKLNQTTAREITSFDRKAGFAEGTYQLNAVPKSAKIGAYKVGGDSPRATKTGPTKFKHFTKGIREVIGGQKAIED